MDLKMVLNLEHITLHYNKVLHETCLYDAVLLMYNRILLRLISNTWHLNFSPYKNVQLVKFSVINSRRPAQVLYYSKSLH